MITAARRTRETVDHFSDYCRWGITKGVGLPPTPLIAIRETGRGRGTRDREQSREEVEGGGGCRFFFFFFF